MTDERGKRKYAYIAMITIPRLNSPEVCVTQTHERSSTNQGDYMKKVSNRGMEHGGMCKSTHI